MDFLFDEIQRFTFTNNMFSRERGSSEIMLQYRMMLKRAKRYVVDNELLEYAIRLSLDPKHVAMAFRTCKIPFENLYLEFDHHQQMRLLNQYSHLEHGLLLDDVSMRAGYFLQKGEHAHQWSVSEFISDVEDDHQALPSPIVYHFDLDGTPENPVKVPPSRLKLPQGAEYVCLGYAEGEGAYKSIVVPYWANGKIGASLEPLSALRCRHTTNDQLVTDKIWNCMKEYRGQMRVVLTILSLLVQLPVSTTTVEGSKSHLMGGRKIKNLSHEYLYIEVPKKNKFAWIKSEHTLAYKKRRRHDVSGYYRKSGRWVDGYERGDASLGYVNKTRKAKYHE